MKLIYINSASLWSQGLHFVQGKEYEVSDKTGKLLLERFGKYFKVVETPKVEPKETPKPKRTTRRATK